MKHYTMFTSLQYFIFILTTALSSLAFYDPKPVADQINTGKIEKTYTEYRDVSYGDAAGSDNLLDAFLPNDRTPSTKVIVYIHGGSWVQGDKKEFPQTLVDELVGKQKYALASINYRLVNDGKNIFPAQIEDVKKALAFINEKAGAFTYDGNNFALIGASAGAHLAMLYAYGYDTLKQVKTVIDIFGPTDLSDKTVREKGLESNDIITNFLATGDTTSPIVKQASPYYRLTAKTGVPTILFHGTADELVNVGQSEKLHKKLNALNIPTQLELYPGEKHELKPAVAMSVFTKMIIWLRKYYPA